MSAAENLLAEFPPVGTAEWEAAIATDLKGASYDEKLIWHAPEGLAIRPYYRAADLPGLDLPDLDGTDPDLPGPEATGLDWAGATPGAFPFVRGARARAGWHIREEIAATEPAAANRAAVAALAAGAEAIAFREISITSRSELALLFVHLDEIPVHFARADETTIRLLLEFLTSGPHRAPISAAFDPFANLAFAAEILAALPAQFLPFTIAVSRVAPATANAVEQTGWALAAAVDFLAAMDERGIDPDRTAAAVEFSFDLGVNYFFEIARLRAFRMLWARVVESFGGSRHHAQARIAAHTAYPQTASGSAHWNILRATTECMSAILGGADSICSAPCAEAGEAQDEAARRLARNTQLILKQEAFFARVADPGGGSYYLENLIASIAAEAWKIMQSVEASGSYRVAAKTRTTQARRSQCRDVVMMERQ